MLSKAINRPGYESQKAASYPVTLFDDNLSNFTRTQEAPVWVQTAGTYFEGNNFYVYIRGTEDPAGAWWEDVPSAQAVQDAAGVLVNCHFDSYVPQRPYAYAVADTVFVAGCRPDLAQRMMGWAASASCNS